MQPNTNTINEEMGGYKVLQCYVHTQDLSPSDFHVPSFDLVRGRSYEAPHYAVFFSLPQLPNIFLSNLFLDTLRLCSSRGVGD
jgi:hypothetical protein